MAPTVGHETNTFSTCFSLKMVSTHSRAGANKQADAGPSRPPSITPDLAAILDDLAKMQQELADLKKRSAEEMEALRQENSRLKRRIEVDPNLKGKAKETSEAVKSPAFQPTEEESEYNPTPHTFTPPSRHPLPLPIPISFYLVNRGLPHPQPPPPPFLPPRSPTTYPPPSTPHIFHPITHNIFPQPTFPLTT